MGLPPACGLDLENLKLRHFGKKWNPGTGRICRVDTRGTTAMMWANSRAIENHSSEIE
jgi:hypothetical protein